MIAYKGRIIFDFLEQSRRQYVVPVYQRNYDWGIPQCQKLFEDIVDAQKNNKNHYVGTVVTAAGSKIGSIENFYIIDGQQRLTSIYILLKALYDLADESEKPTIKEWLFNKNRFEDLNIDLASKLKLKSDNEQIQLLMQDRLDEMDKSSTVYCNYLKFKDMAENELNNGMYVKDICSGIDKLVCAKVELDVNDNPQEVFESINSTGCPLTISDLIRNYILMIDDDQTRLYNTYWIKLEKYIEKENMSVFILDYLNFKTDGFVKENMAYNCFKKLYKNNNYSNESMLQELTHYAKFYNYFLNGSDDLTDEINNYLSALRQLRQTTLYVFLFSVFDDYELKIISANDVAKILKFLLNYTVRRTVCEIGSNSLRGLFKTLYARIFNKKENLNHYVDAILSFFKQLNTKDKLPSDKLFEECLTERDLYHKNNICKYILSAIENKNTKEPIEIKSLTIEHIMPQNDNLSKEWKIMLGENWNEIHAKYLNTLGNLTLTGYNSELSDKPFHDKMEMVSLNSKIKNLNIDVIDKKEWNEENIKIRGQRLSKEVVELFKIDEPIVEVSYNDIRYKEYGIDNSQDAKFKYPNYFVLQGEKVEVTDFTRMLESVLTILYQQDHSIMERIAKNNEKTISWSQKVYISYNKNQFKYSEEINGTGIYFDVNLSSPDKISLIKAILQEYGIDAEEFVYSARTNTKKQNKADI